MNMKNPKISIITTFYNREKYLAQCIESIRNQTETDFEYILWDDGSTDNSLRIALDHYTDDDRITFVKAPHRGFPHGLLSAMNLAKGEYIGWVDSDDWIARDCLKLTKDVLENNSNVGLVYTNYYEIDENNKNLGLGSRCLVPYMGKDTLLVTFMTFHFRLFRKIVWDSLSEPISLTCNSAGDYDFCLKASEITDFFHLENPLYFYRIHFDSISNKKIKQQREYAALARQNALVRRGYH